MEAKIDEILNRWPAVGLAVGVVRDGALEFFSARGAADIESGPRRCPRTSSGLPPVTAVNAESATLTEIAPSSVYRLGPAIAFSWARRRRSR
jgi:hypothetical protein